MTNNEILKRAIKKANKNGFNFWCDFFLYEKEPIVKGWEFLKCKNLVNVQVDSTTRTVIGLNDIIFSHNFAKAFWGTYREDCGCTSLNCRHQHSWQYYLQQMILKENPLKYLEKFL